MLINRLKIVFQNKLHSSAGQIQINTSQRGVYTGGKGLLTGWMVFWLQVDGPITGGEGGGGGGGRL